MVRSLGSNSAEFGGPMLTLSPREPETTLTQWLYDELRRAILDGRLRRGSPVPTTRALAATYRISRRIVVEVFERLRDEGYLHAQVGVGTHVSDTLPEDYLAGVAPHAQTQPRQASREDLTQHAVHGWPIRPFRAFEPALSEFPLELWGKLTARCLRRTSKAILAGGDAAGLHALREAIAEYLGVARGVKCTAEDIIITSGSQQGLDLLARVLLRPDDAVWVEDPAYLDAVEIFRLTGARIIPVPVDEHGLDIERGRAQCPRPKLIYVTPAHQFPLGMSLQLERRLELLQWTRREQSMVIEDDYDSEFRFAGNPLPAIKGLAGAEHVFLVGTFSKCLFPSLRLGYIVAPQAWCDALLKLRRQVERYPPGLPQLVLAEFITAGHFARHLRKMRELYAQRHALLRGEVEARMGGLLQIPGIEAGLNTPAYLLNSMTSEHAAQRARQRNLEVWPLDRYALARHDLRGLLLGFAALTERQIRAGVTELARALM
jgi:GntR family transcriptional regulator / MocR family aminotransferase